jgi:hypothetical protein
MLMDEITRLGVNKPKGKAGKGKGKASGEPQVVLPKRTLDKRDFAKGAEHLLRRSKEVASEVKGALTGRVRSAKGKDWFNEEHTISYQEWWKKASSDAKAGSLCDQKHYLELSVEEKDKLKDLECPFQGPLDFQVAEREEEGETETETGFGFGIPPSF